MNPSIQKSNSTFFQPLGWFSKSKQFDAQYEIRRARWMADVT